MARSFLSGSQQTVKFPLNFVVPFIFVLKTSSIGAQCVQKTTAGQCCSIPFTYKGVTYHSRTKADHDKLWCSLDAVYKGNWGDCGKHCNDVAINYM